MSDVDALHEGQAPFALRPELSDPRVLRATAWTFRATAWGTAAWLIGWAPSAILAAVAVLTLLLSRAVQATAPRTLVRRLLVVVAIAANAGAFVAVVAPGAWNLPVLAGAGVLMCHGIAFIVDVAGGKADPRRHGAALLYLLQLPVFPAGPLSRFQEFSQQVARADVSMAGFAYGVRRITTGLTKIFLLAWPLGSTADEIFALRVTRLSTGTAWLGAVCVSLEVYFWLGGFTDIGIGVGKVLGFRYQENFRRPYTADSVREFWRRWNVTLMTWLRDYLRFPVAATDRQTPGRFLLTVVGLMIVGLWYRPSVAVVPWSIYMGAWLAIEALGLGTWLARLPRVVRHAYVLLVVLFGWTLLRASGPGPLLGYVEAMLGFSVAKTAGVSTYLTPWLVVALVCAIVFAGPLVGNISRWRVSVDAATASLLMMLAATAVLVWKWSLPLVRTVLPERAAGRTPPRARR